ncbi:MFS transporter [Streptomyces sennicomposti]|uniref:MFS transporter n=1 Tax=Streptomyces sennicomposti TaxID=2873384 RepID=UPI001CA659B5|nr:MFS transporter [Streptomyces sennicomposti]MBY8865815.1 MFS transporter [Streptomyces sennicomposti]
MTPEPKSAAGEARPTPVERRNARLYLAGLGLSMVGDTALSLVAGIWVKSLTGSSALAGLTQTCIYLPSLFGPLAGLVADRVPRQRFLILVNLCTAIAVACLLLVDGEEDVWLICAVMAAYGASLVLIDPAESALFAHMFRPSTRRRINGLRLGMQETGRLVSPLVGAGLFTWLGGGAVALLDAATFVAAAAATSLLKPPPERARPARTRWRTEILAGAAHIRATPALARILVVAALIMAVSGVGVAAQYSMVAALHQPPGYLGVLAALLGGASVVASLASSRVLARTGPTRLALLGLAAFAAGSALRAVPWLPAVWLGSFVLGFALPWVFLAALNAGQQLTPDHLQGRVAAATTLLLFGPQAPAQALGSLLIAHIGYRSVYLASAATALVLAAALVHLTRRSPHPEHPERTTATADEP